MHVRLPEPGDWRQFCIQVARHFSRPMDMNRPLWDIYVVEGLDRIDGIAPAIAIRQKNTVRNPRSTVGTTTEIHDYMRLLFARVGRTYCRTCGKPVVRETAELVAAEFTNVEAIARILAQFKRDGIGVVEITPSFTLTGRRREIVNLATLNRIALVAHRSEWADAGAILTYGIDVQENYRRAAAIAHRILQGAKPAQTAVELPNLLELVVNPGAALSFGIAKIGRAHV